MPTVPDRASRATALIARRNDASVERSGSGSHTREFGPTSVEARTIDHGHATRVDCVESSDSAKPCVEARSMKKSRNPRSRAAARQLGLGAILTALAIGAPFGCTREFYREWANQDVSEAVFEKTRDPRWRMDIFSVEPPMLSRFADPYDQDVPPAPPDDPAAEALSPVPQWPDNRLLMPVEGTGYLDLLEYWRRRERGGRKAAAAGHPVPGRRARILAAPRQWPAPGHRPAPAGDARPAPELAGRPARAT